MTREWEGIRADMIADPSTRMYVFNCGRCDYHTGRHSLIGKAEQAYATHWRMKHKASWLREIGR